MTNEYVGGGKNSRMMSIQWVYQQNNTDITDFVCRYRIFHTMFIVYGIAEISAEWWYKIHALHKNVFFSM